MIQGIRRNIRHRELSLPCSSERAPSGRSLCLEVRFKHLASFLGLLALNCCVERHFARSRRYVRNAHRHHARSRATGTTWSTKSEPQHGRTGEKLRENPTMLTARPASDCRENGAGIQLSGIARLERGRLPLFIALTVSLSSIFLPAGGDSSLLRYTAAAAPAAYRPFRRARSPPLDHRSVSPTTPPPTSV